MIAEEFFNNRFDKDNIRDEWVSTFESWKKDLIEFAEEYHEAKLKEQQQTETEALNIADVSGSASKNELILKLLENIESEKGGEIKEYENTLLCGKGKITLTINIE